MVWVQLEDRPRSSEVALILWVPMDSWSAPPFTLQLSVLFLLLLVLALPAIFRLPFSPLQESRQRAPPCFLPI